MKSVVLAVLVMGSLGAKAAPVTDVSPQNPKFVALLKKLDGEKYGASPKAALSAYLVMIENSVRDGEGLELAKATQDCVDHFFGAKAGEVRARGLETFPGSKAAQAKAMAARVKAVSVDYSDMVNRMVLENCKGM